MLIKSIEIRNFRQLNNIKLNFSTDSNKNVSIISGNNGAGKTTLAEAFTWCLYGEVKSNLSILNKDKEEKLKENYGAEVYVKIELEHNNAKYEIIRKQTFKRKKNGEVSTSSQDISREVVRKLKDGRSVHIRELEIDNEIDKILPKDLAKYFFFDGERINSMSKSIEKGGKNSDFAVAVKNLLGLAPFLEAKDHLKFIQKKYREAYQDDGNQKIIKYREGIRKYEEDIIKFKERIEEIESELEIKSKRRDLITEELLKLKDSAELAKQRREYEEQIEHLEKEKLNYEEDITDLINRDMLSFVSQYYIKEAKKILEKNGRVTADGMVESAMYHVNLLEKYGFNNIIISLKASNVKMMVDAYRKISELVDYPLHLGVTEAGTEFQGTVKSAIGIGSLLVDGIGNTIRVSLTENPVEEIKVAKEILKVLGLREGVEIVSCPTCGRTQIDLIGLAKKVEKEFGNIEKNIKIAVMGCVVNGPGEAKEADIGVAGGKGEGLLFKKGEIIKKVKEEEIIPELRKMLEEIL